MFLRKTVIVETTIKNYGSSLLGMVQ